MRSGAPPLTSTCERRPGMPVIYGRIRLGPFADRLLLRRPHTTEPLRRPWRPLVLCLVLPMAGHAESLKPPFQLTFDPRASEPMAFTIAADTPVVLEVEQDFADITVEVPSRKLVIDGPTGDGGLELVLIESGTEPVAVRLGLFASPSAESHIQVRAAIAPEPGTSAWRGWQAVSEAGGAFQRGGSDLVTARRLYLAASAWFRLADQSRLASHALYNAAAVSRILHDFVLAERIYTSIIDDPGLGDDFLRARAHHMRGIVFRLREDVTAARTEYELAEALYRQLERPRRIADVAVDRCALERIAGRESAAEQCLKDLQEILEPLDDHHRLSHVANNLANLYEQVGRYEEAEAAFDLAIAYASRAPVHNAQLDRAIGNALHNRARLRGQRGDEHAALVDYLSALQRLPRSDARLRSYVFLNVSSIYARMGYGQLAQAFLDWARDQHSGVESLEVTVLALLDSARLAARGDDAETAVDLLREARRLVSAAEGNPRLRAIAAIREISVCRALQDLDCVREAADRARQTADQADLASLKAEVALADALIALEEQRTEDALRLAQVALDASPTPMLTAQAALTVGEILDRRNDPAAVAYYRRAHATLSQSANSQVLLPDQSALHDRIARHLIDGLATTIQAGDSSVDEVLQLLQELGESPHQASVADADSVRRRQAAAAILAGESLTADDGSAEAVLTALLEIESSLEMGLVDAAPPVTLDELQARLEVDQLLVTYLLGERVSIGLTIRSDGWSFAQLAGTDDLVGQSRLWRDAIEQRDLAERQLAESLGSKLLPESLCCDGANQVFFYDAGRLLHVPLSALVSPANGQRLADGLAVIRLSSLSANRSTDPNPDADRLRFVGVGDPVFGSNDPRLVNASSQTATPPLNRLGGSDLEWAPALAGIEASHVRELVGFDATKPNVLDPRVLDARILHLATHALGNPRYGIGSGFFLTRHQPGGRLIDGFVSAVEIAVRQVAADLVVLSACDTGYSSSGLNLADSFVRAGADNVVASLWPVSNRATRALMEAFYTRLIRHDEPAAIALLHAQRKVAASGPWSHPYFWAAFQLHTWSLTP